MGEFDFSDVARPVEPAQVAEEGEIEKSLRPESLDEFVGQRQVREQLGVFIDAAKGRGEALDHALFAGPPGLGKCVTPETLILTPQGMVPIGSLGDLHGESWQPIMRPLEGLYGMRTADYFYNNGECNTLRVTTRSGYRVEGTPNHPVLIRTPEGELGFRRLEELKSGDHLAVRIGAQVFGSSTRLGIEGIAMPSLSDPIVIPDHLTVDLAQAIGFMLTRARVSPGGDGVVLNLSSDEDIEIATEIFTRVFCMHIESYGATPLGQRYAARSPRMAKFLIGLGCTKEGFTEIPRCIFRAPKAQVASFVKGVLTASAGRLPNRLMASHLQQILINFGIESQITPSGSGQWMIEALEGEVAEYNTYRPLFNYDEVSSDPPVSEHDAESFPAGFGMTPAGVLVALGEDHDGTDEYKRGRHQTESMLAVSVSGGAEISIEPLAASADQWAKGYGLRDFSRPMHESHHVSTSVSVAEVEPSERGRALLRGSAIRSDVRALAVRSVKSDLSKEDTVELIWEPVVSIEPSHAHTCDVSVPDGHTFVGNAIICHNTTLATVVANELGATLHQTSGPAMEKKADVAAILTSLAPQDVLFIDEIHRMSTAIEEVLYSAMEDYHIDIILGQGPAARTLRLDLAPFTLIGATTRTGLLTTPLRDRFGLIHRLDYYDKDELTDIVKRSAGLLGLQIDDLAAQVIAGRSRGTPRIANRLLRRVRDVAQVRHSGSVSSEIAHEALDLVDVDHAGLDRVDRLILRTIAESFSGGPVGLSTLAVAIGEERHTVEDVYEPFLIQRGLLQRTPRGRIITARALQHLGLPESGLSEAAGNGRSDTSNDQLTLG